MRDRNFTNFNEFLNIRYIRSVKGIYMNPSDFDYMIERFRKISEENDKLKAEIEILNEKSNGILDIYNKTKEMKNTYMSKYHDNFERNKELKSEIEQLKESRNYISEVNGSLVRINDKQDMEITKLKDEIEQLKIDLEYATNLMPKICETCEYEDELGWKEPCNSCSHCKNWKLKGMVEE